MNCLFGLATFVTFSHCYIREIVPNEVTVHMFIQEFRGVVGHRSWTYLNLNISDFIDRPDYGSAHHRGEDVGRKVAAGISTLYELKSPDI